MDDQDVYVVSLYSAPMPWPLSFAVHLWFVIEHNGVTNRVEVWAPTHSKLENPSCIVYDVYPLTQGCRVSIFENVHKPIKVSHSKKLFTLTGKNGSLAQKLYIAIVDAKGNYPYEYTYRFYPGPNSNTFVAWVAKMVPEARLALPWNAFGKGDLLPKV